MWVIIQGNCRTDQVYKFDVICVNPRDLRISQVGHATFISLNNCMILHDVFRSIIRMLFTSFKFNLECNSYSINNVTECLTVFFFVFSTFCLVLYWLPSIVAIGKRPPRNKYAYQTRPLIVYQIFHYERMTTRSWSR